MGLMRVQKVIQTKTEMGNVKVQSNDIAVTLGGLGKKVKISKKTLSFGGFMNKSRVWVVSTKYQKYANVKLDHFLRYRGEHKQYERSGRSTRWSLGMGDLQI